MAKRLPLLLGSLGLVALLIGCAPEQDPAAKEYKGPAPGKPGSPSVGGTPPPVAGGPAPKTGQ